MTPGTPAALLRGSAPGWVRSRAQAVWIAAPALAGILVFFIAPALVFCVYGFLTKQAFDVSGPLTLDAYRTALSTDVNRDLALNSLRTGATVALITVLCALPVAYWLRYLAGRWQLPVLFVIVVSMFAGYLVRIYSWRTILGREGLVNHALQAAHLIDSPLSLVFNRFAVIVAEVHLYLPYAVLILFTGLRPIEPSYLEAAQDLGANALMRWRRVLLPLMAAPMVSVFGFVFILGATDWFTPYYLGGKSGGLLGERIFVLFRSTGDYPQGAALSLMTLVAFVLCYTLAVLGLRLLRLNRIRWAS